MTTFTFNKNYRDTEQVRQFMPAFLARFAQIDPTMRFAYNDQFKGCVCDGDEDTAIYLCQTLKSLDELRTKVAAAIGDGCVPVESVDTTTKYARIVHYGWYMGGTGWQEWRGAD